MTKTLTEQWREGKLPEDCYYILTKNGHIRKDRTCFYSHTDEQCFCFTSNKDIKEVLAPVPSYQQLYGPNDGRIPVGLFTVLKLIKRDIERTQEYRNLTDLECGIKSQVVSLLKRWGWDLGKDELVSNSDELEKQLATATKALKEYANKDKWHYCSEDIEYFYTTKDGWYYAEQALKEMEGVK